MGWRSCRAGGGTALQDVEGRAAATKLCPEMLEPQPQPAATHRAPGSKYSCALCPRPQDVYYLPLASAFKLFLEALGEQELPLLQKS